MFGVEMNNRDILQYENLAFISAAEERWLYS